VLNYGMFYIIIFALLAVLLVVSGTTVIVQRRRRLEAEERHYGENRDGAHRERKAARAQSRHDRRKRH
jgi:uncharacterized iron-regulated membrane protein